MTTGGAPILQESSSHCACDCLPDDWANEEGDRLGFMLYRMDADLTFPAQAQATAPILLPVRLRELREGFARSNLILTGCRDAHLHNEYFPDRRS